MPFAYPDPLRTADAGPLFLRRSVRRSARARGTRTRLTAIAGIVALALGGLASTTPAAGTTVAADAARTPTEQYIVKVYSDLFGRTPDPPGLQNWSAALQSGAPRVAVANAITASAEYRGALIVASYHQYLGRGPDGAGLANWLGAMNRGLTIQQIESGFIARLRRPLVDAPRIVPESLADVLDHNRQRGRLAARPTSYLD